MEIRKIHDPNIAFCGYEDTDTFKIYDLSCSEFLVVFGESEYFTKTQCLQLINSVKDSNIMDYVVVGGDYPSFAAPVFIGMRWEKEKYPLILENGTLPNLQHGERQISQSV